MCLRIVVARDTSGRTNSMYLSGSNGDDSHLDGWFNLKNFFQGAVDLAKNPFKTPFKHLKQHISVLTKPKTQDLPAEWVAPPLPPAYVPPPANTLMVDQQRATVEQQRFQMQAQMNQGNAQQNAPYGVPLWAWGAGAGVGLLGLYLVTRKSGGR